MKHAYDKDKKTMFMSLQQTDNAQKNMFHEYLLFESSLKMD